MGRLMRLAQSTDPEGVVEALSMSVAELGGSDVVLYLVDYEHQHLVPYPDVLPGCPRRFLLRVAVSEVLLVCNVRKGRLLDDMPCFSVSRLVTTFYTFISSSGLRRAGTRRPWPLRYSDLSCSA